MPTLKDISNQLQYIINLKTIADAYSQISSLKLQKIRRGIEQNRQFFQKLMSVYRLVKVAALQSGVVPPQKRKGQISILLTSNHRFYGALELKLTKFFAENTAKYKTVRLAIGKMANEYMHSLQVLLPYQSFVFRDDLPTDQELHKLIEVVSSYQQILVYYSRMESILSQEPHVVDILQQPVSQNELSGPTFDYIFEPEIGKMVDFFDNQITVVLLMQTFLESELARTASRLMAMDQAQRNANEFLENQQKVYSLAKKSAENVKIVENIIAIKSTAK